MRGAEVFAVLTHERFQRQRRLTADPLDDIGFAAENPFYGAVALTVPRVASKRISDLTAT
jgi:hypothetical protein